MRSFTSWTQVYFFDWLANIGGLFTSLMAIARFAMAGYQNFVAQKSMLKRLYAEEVQTQQAVNSGIQSNDSAAQETLRAKLMNRKEFNASYLSFAFVGCCYRVKCCFKGKRKRHLESYEKF